MRVSPSGTMPPGETIETIATIADPAAPDRGWTFGLAFDRAYLVETDCCRLAGEVRPFPHALDALEALDAAQRAAVGLDDARYDALRVLDALRAALARDDVRTARELAPRCLDVLGAAFGVAAAGEGKVRRPVLDTMEQRTRFAEHVVADFARAPDEALARLRQLAVSLGVLARDDRALRTAFATPAPTGPTVMLPIEVAHPVHRDVRVREVPWISPDERPDLVFPPADRYAGSTIVVHALTALYADLHHVGQRIAHLQRIEAPEPVLEQEARRLQRIVDDLAAVAQAPPTVVDAWELSTTRIDRVPLSHRGPDPMTDGLEPPPAALWLDADTIAVTRGDRLVTISLATARVVREYPLGHAVVHACDDSGRFVLAGAESVDYGGFGLGCLDLHAGAWLDELDARMPAVSFGYDELSVSTLYDHRRDARMRGIVALCFARGSRSVLLSRCNDVIADYGICATATLFSEVSFATLDAAVRAAAVPILLADGSLVDPTPAHAERIEREMQERTAARSQLPWPAAIARRDDRWCYLLPSLHAGDTLGAYFRLGFGIDAACFSPDGRRLLVVADELLVIELPGGAIAWRSPR